jgi:hypothetical protein
MRKRFDKSPAIDAASNLRLVTMIENHDGDDSARELEILEEGKTMLEVFKQQKSKELKMASRTTQAKMAFKDGQSHAYGWSSAVVRASPAQVLAYVWDVKKRAGVYADDLEKTLDEDGEHSKLMYVRGGSEAMQSCCYLPRATLVTPPLLTPTPTQIQKKEGAQPVRQQGLPLQMRLAEASNGVHLRERP